MTTRKGPKRKGTQLITLDGREDFSFVFKRRRGHRDRIKKNLGRLGRRKTFQLEVTVETFKKGKSQGTRTLRTASVHRKDFWDAYHNTIRRALRRDSEVAIITTNIAAIIRRRSTGKKRVR